VVFTSTFAAGLLAVALAPWLPLAIACMVPVGVGSVGMLVTGNGHVQLACDARMRGRVMALWTTCVLGSRPIGAPIVGAVSEGLGPRYGVALGGLSILLFAMPAWLLLAEFDRAGLRLRPGFSRPGR
jgi:MFS family permease